MSVAVNLLKFIIENNLLDAFSETSNLLKNVITIPMTTTEAEYSFSTLKWIKTFLQSAMFEDQLWTLFISSIEKYMIKNNVFNFNKKVINVFSVEKERRIELNYKNVTD